jgi:hypothetical protein
MALVRFQRSAQAVSLVISAYVPWKYTSGKKYTKGLSVRCYSFPHRQAHQGEGTL